MTDIRTHWNTAYETKGEAGVSWYDAAASESFDRIAPLVAPGDPILDLGGGASHLVDRLLDDHGRAVIDAGHQRRAGTGRQAGDLVVFDARRGGRVVLHTNELWRHGQRTPINPKRVAGL